MKKTAIEGIFHTHSMYSSDGKLSLKELREECLKRNLNFVIMTEHAGDFDQTKMEMFVKNCAGISDKDFLAVPGLEFIFNGNRDLHLLAIGLRSLPEDQSLEKIIEQTRLQGGLTVVAHPSRNNHYIPLKIRYKIDGMEIWNAAYDSRYLPDVRAIKLYKKLKKHHRNLIGFGGLDLHDRTGFRDLRISITQDYRNVDQLLGHLRSGRFENHGRHITIPSTPDTGIFQLTLFRMGRFLLDIADTIKWKLIKASLFPAL